MSKLTLLCLCIVSSVIAYGIFGMCYIPLAIGFVVGPYLNEKYDPQKVGWGKSLAVGLPFIIIITIATFVLLGIEHPYAF